MTNKQIVEGVFTVVLSVVAEYLVNAVDGPRSGRHPGGHAVSVHHVAAGRAEPHCLTGG